MGRETAGGTFGALFLDVAPTFEITGGIVGAHVSTGELEFEFRCSPHTLMVAIERAQKVLNEWRASECNCVIQIARNHAARS